MFNITQNSSVFFFNLVPSTIQNTLDYDYLIKRDPSIKGIILPGSDQRFYKCFFGSKEIIIPIFQNYQEAHNLYPEVDTLLNFASARSAFSTSKEAFLTGFFKKVAIVAEGIPENQSRELSQLSKSLDILLFGPATVGLMIAGKLRVGNIGGSIENIVESKLYQQGSVGLVTRSGGLCNELCNIISKNSDGISSAFAIGGDRFIGQDFISLVLALQDDPQTKVIVVLGEVGGRLEYELIEAIQSKQITKPVIGYCIGESASLLGKNIQFGHAGAQANKIEEEAGYKNDQMKKAGILVPDSFDEIELLLQKVSQDLKLSKTKDKNLTLPPAEFKDLRNQNKVRKPSSFICTISDDRGSEFTINKTPITELLSDESIGISDIITLLWFKQKYPVWASKFIDLIIKLLADHGPAVSGAHNAKVTARAGKDVISSLVTGLLTIGPRFGGAIDGAAVEFFNATTNNIAPIDFVNNMKLQNKKIPGIGHKIKSIHNPDQRVEILVNYAKQNFPSTKVLDFAKQVESITTSKKTNLILNVDGTIASLMIDLWKGIGLSDTEIQDLIESGVLNAFFAVSRSIGFVGHILDEKRLQQPLYRHDTDDILYL